MRRKILIDANGEEYPAYELDSHIIKQDTFVKKLISKAIRLQDRIEADKKKMNNEIQKYIKKTRNPIDGKEPNLELISFDGRHKVEIKNKITFYRRTSPDQPFEVMSLNFDEI
ncbi:MAG: hypothetical protein APR54_00005 [Candidatus Cloacimonas sp. SDB]|nr:MAG: hypothetical protein APR54_00005 [Candidatus Cloacimonas sp. SDB]